MSASAVLSDRLRIAVAGASGRMGHMLIDATLASADCVLAAALDHAESPALGQTAAPGVLIQSDVAQALAGCDVLIDFTRPEGSVAHAKACAAAGVKLVIGTTGFDAEQLKAIELASTSTAIVLAPNMSVGVNVTFKLLELAAKALNMGYDIEIIEAHHRHKVDAPSGTALKMGEVIASAQGKVLADVADWARHGHTGPRQTGHIGFSAVRAGNIVGDHTAMFVGTGERIEITHRSESREGYAQGSLMAARFLRGRARGLFDMFDVLNLR